MSETIVETLEPTITKPVTITLYERHGEFERELIYTQQPLSFFGKLELFSILGGALERAIDEGLSLSEVLDVPKERETNTPLSTNTLLEADTFVKGVAKLARYAPDITKDIFCVSLRVPHQEREIVKELMDDQVSDEQGGEMLRGFVTDNMEALKSFFSEQILPLVESLSSMGQNSTPSKPSKTTPRNTRKQSKKS